MSTPTTYWITIPGSSKPPIGPLGVDEIAARVKSGTLPRDAEVCVVGASEWTPIRDLLPPDEPTYEVTVDGEKVIGPVTLDQLRRGLQVGKLPPDARVRTPGSSNWLPVAQVLAPAPAAVPAPKTVTATKAASAHGLTKGQQAALAAVAFAIVLGAVVFVVVRGRSASTAPSSTGSSSSPASSKSAPVDPATMAPAEAAKHGFKLWDGTPSNLKGAVPFFKAACDGGDDLGCAGLGYAYIAGPEAGLVQDFAKAKTLVDPLCTKGNQRACSTVGKFYFFAWGVPKDQERARKLWQIACDADEYRACYLLGMSLSLSDLPPEQRDLPTAIVKLKKACSLGDKDGCDLAGQVEKVAELDRLKLLVRCVRIVNSDGTDDNDICVSKGLPRIHRECKGSKYEDNQTVANSMGCVHQNYVSTSPSMWDPGFNDFCCPK